MTWTFVGVEYATSVAGFSETCAIPAGTAAGDAVLVLLTTTSPYYSTNSGALVATAMEALSLASLGYNPLVSPTHMRSLRSYLYRHDGVATDITFSCPVSDNYADCIVVVYRPPTDRSVGESAATITPTVASDSPDLSTTPEARSNCLLLQGEWFWAAYPTLVVLAEPGTRIATDAGIYLNEVNLSSGGFSGVGAWTYDTPEYPDQLPFGFTIWLQDANPAGVGGWTVGSLGFG